MTQAAGISAQHASKICGIVVVSRPDSALGTRLASLAQQVGAIVVVINGPVQVDTSLVETSSGRSILAIQNDSNLGIAAALNQGLRRAGDLGCEWALTLDQDSDPAPDIVMQQMQALQQASVKDRVCIVGARVINRGVGTEARYLRKAFGPVYRRSLCTGQVLEDVTSVITSGSLVRLGAFRDLGGFREDFFIDYVDTEFCLRALSRGYRIIVACEARLEHQLGRRTKASLGPLALYPTHHSPGRWYYMSRNRIPMIRRYGLQVPHWLSYEIVASSYVMLRMLLTEHERRQKLKAFLRGTWDGLRGRMGPMPGSPEAVVSPEAAANG